MTTFDQRRVRGEVVARVTCLDHIT